MPHRAILLITLLTLITVGATTLWLVLAPAASEAPQVMWWLFLVVLPVALATAILIGWTWAAMLCVVYGTIGLALDLATVVSVLGGREGSDLTLCLSIVSGSANGVLIIFGGRAFSSLLEERRPPGSRPPSPPFPSSSSPV
jgi:hypothetical protein